MFLLYSGYGIMESLKRNREKYTRTFLTHRVVKVWLMFAIAVSLFFILSLILGTNYSLKQYLLCWIGWEHIGNSNWFVFDILMLYLLTYIALQICARRNISSLKKLVVGIYILTFLFIAFLTLSGKGIYWLDTIIAYPTGMLYSIYKDKIDSWISRKNRWLWSFISMTLIFIGLYFLVRVVNPAKFPEIQGLARRIFISVHLLIYVCVSSVFALDLVLLTMKLKMDNAALRWLGVNAFAIYILQRLAMIICTRFGFNENAVLFACIVIPATLLIASVFTAATNRLNRTLFP